MTDIGESFECFSDRFLVLIGHHRGLGDSSEGEKNGERTKGENGVPILN